MLDAIVELINFNRGLDYRVILAIFIGYIVLIWMIVVLWAYFDAKRRYSNPIHQVLIGLATFLLGIPFVLLYLLIRPDELYDEDDDRSSEVQKGGVNIPMINFVGKEGIEMTLTLNVSHKVNEVKPTDLKIGVSIEPDEKKFEIKEVEKLVDETEKIEDKIDKGHKVGSLVSNLKKGLETLRQKLVKKKPVTTEVVEFQGEPLEIDGMNKDQKKRRGGRRKNK